MRRALLIASFLCLATALTASPSQADWPEWMDRWLYNAEERTRRGAESLEEKNYDQAAAAMDAARRLAPEDATAAFNAGTARLPLAPEQGRELLKNADELSNDPVLSSRAHYNAGNSLLEAGEYQPAIDAYKNSLRRDPTFEDAKFNLELAQKKLQEQQQNQDQQNQDQQNQDQQDQQDQEQNQDQQDQEQNQDQQQDQEQDQQDQEQSQDQQNQDQQDQEQEQEQQDQNQQDQEQQGQEQEQEQQQQDPQNQEQQNENGSGQDQQESPLPQFEDLPDMTAEEAAAILEAIENMEREQRRQEALEAAKANVGGKKDW